MSDAQPVGSLDVALAHAERLLTRNPAQALEQADEILNAAAHPRAMLVKGVALRALGEGMRAHQVLAGLVAAQPRWAAAHYEFAGASADLGDAAAAAASLRVAVALKPDFAAAWRALGDHLLAEGDAAGADEAYAQLIRASTSDPRLVEAALALCDNRLAVAERALRAHLMEAPTDVAAIRMFAEVAARLGRFADAEALLTRCLELAPSFEAARHNLAIALYRQNKLPEALAEIEKLRAADPNNLSARNLRAAVLARIGEYEGAIETFAGIIAETPDHPKVWMSYGHALKTAGRRADSIDAYRKSIALAPHFGEAYWSLANLKTFQFDGADVAAMQTALATPDLGAEDRFHLHYALGKALEDARDYAGAFAHYADGAALRRAQIDYDGAEISDQARRAKALFTADFLAARAGQGAAAPDPIFVVGLPRSGSTLVEQILASHSQVEGTMELPDLGLIARRLSQKKLKSDPSLYPEVLAELDAATLGALGEGYIASTRVQRKTARPLFIDKMPNNWQHVGLIRLILPNAKIIDARRHPMATCFSAFKQHFARGQGFSYDLGELGRFWRDYAELMAHFDAVAPGAVHRVFYERMVAETEAEVRALLSHCGLDFEPACLDFHANARAVRTASSEQVRQPIFTDAVDHWRNFEQYLEPLRLALGPALDGYPFR